jgi:hypothetical protein
MILGFLLGNFGEILGKLLTGYIKNGWPFALMHGFVLFSIIYHTWYRKIRVETEALRAWKPDTLNNPENDSGAETTSILNHFLEEIKTLGPQGFLVPITDFSDRVDSLIDGLISELHDRINLFLLVGVTGTLFGLFEFGFRAYEALTSQTVDANDRIRLLGEYLSLSISKAFPVGFVGLALTFIFQIFAAFPERRLREMLSEATRKALVKRKELSVSQANVVLKSANAIKEALEPLSDLKLTLTESIQPVVKEFGSRLDQSLTLVKTQFDEIQRTTVSLKSAVDSVNSGVVILNSVVINLKNLLQNIPTVLENTIKLQEMELTSLKSFDEVMDSYLKQAQDLNLALNETLTKLDNLPADLIRETKPVLEHLGTDSLAVWRQVSTEFHEILSHDYNTLFDQIDSRIVGVQGQLVTVATDLKAVTGELGTAISALTNLPSRIDSEIKTTFQTLSTESKTEWISMSNKFGQDTQSQYVNYMRTIETQATDASDKLQAASGELFRISMSWEQLLKDPVNKLIDDAKQNISTELKKLDQALIERYPLIASKIETFNTNLETMLRRIQSIQVVLTQWLAGAEKAQNKVHDIHESLVVADLLKANVSQLQQANRLLVTIQEQMPGTDNGVQSEIAASRRLLSEISHGIDKLANKKGWIDRIRGR